MTEYTKEAKMAKAKSNLIIGSLTALAFIAALAPTAYATTDTADSELSQVINAGVLTTDFRDGSNVVVGAPSFSLSATSVSTSQQTVTGTFGSATQRISVDNPGGADNGWTLAIAASNVSDLWTSGGSSYDFNGVASAGRLTFDPSVGTLTSLVGASTGITKGSSAFFSSGTTDSITLLTAASGSDNIWNGYLTGVSVSQTVPAAQSAGAYTLDLVQTATSA
jgi:hypothetical protein